MTTPFENYCKQYMDKECQWCVYDDRIKCWSCVGDPTLHGDNPCKQCDESICLLAQRIMLSNKLNGYKKIEIGWPV